MKDFLCFVGSVFLLILLLALLFVPTPVLQRVVCGSGTSDQSCRCDDTCHDEACEPTACSCNLEGDRKHLDALHDTVIDLCDRTDRLETSVDNLSAKIPPQSPEQRTGFHQCPSGECPLLYIPPKVPTPAQCQIDPALHTAGPALKIKPQVSTVDTGTTALPLVAQHANHKQQRFHCRH